MAERKVVLLRIRPELYEALQRWAHDEFRSVNGHLEYLLSEAVRRVGREKSAGQSAGPGETGPASEAPGEAATPEDVARPDEGPAKPGETGGA